MLIFDFAHFQKLSDEEITRINGIVNRLVRENIPIDERRSTPMSEAQKMGALALFGEKYGEEVRVIKFNDSVELCGGTHVKATGQIGYFRIFRESAIAAGIRRIEAFTGEVAENYVNQHLNALKQISSQFEQQQDLVEAVKEKLKEHETLLKQVEAFRKNALVLMKEKLFKSVQLLDDVRVIIKEVPVKNAGEMKDIAFQLRGEIKNLYMCLGANIDGKDNLALVISDNLVKERSLNAAEIIREISKEIQGGGGGQPFFATAGGKNPEGIERALKLAHKKLEESV